MGATSNFGFPYPESTDTPFVHLDIKALAEGVDNEFASRPKVWFGTVDVTVDNASSGIQQLDISSAGFTATPSFAGVSTNYSYYVYRAAGGTNSATTIAVGVRHFENSTNSTTVTCLIVAIGD